MQHLPRHEQIVWAESAGMLLDLIAVPVQMILTGLRRCPQPR